MKYIRRTEEHSEMVEKEIFRKKKLIRLLV